MKQTILLILSVIYYTAASAQGYGNTMLFGYQGGWYSPTNPVGGINILKFTDGGLQITDDQLIDMWFNDTDAAISDTAGNLLFYYNGIYIEDRTRHIMPGGDTLNPYSETGYDLPQGGIIIPYPEKPDQYILFHSTDVFLEEPDWGPEGSGLYYSVIDMTKNNGLGKVVQRKVPIIIDTLEYGKLAIVRHANGRDWWLAVGKSHSNMMYAVLIDPTGVHPISFADRQSIGIERPQGYGQAFFSPDGSKYVMFTSIGINDLYQFIEIYDFDRCSGKFSNHEQIHLWGHYGGGGVIVSPNSRWLYVPSHNLLYKYDLWADSIATTQELIGEYEPFNDPFPTKFHLGFLAPDDKIYIVTSSGSQTLHVIQKPDEPGTDCFFDQHAVHLPCANSSSLPTFANYRLGPIDGSSCDTLGINNDPVSWWRYEQDTLLPYQFEFRDLSYHEPVNWLWDFGDGSTVTERHPVHEYQNPGTYTVCLTVSNSNGSNTHCKTIYSTVSLSENPVIQSQIQITPNPFNDRVSIAVSTTLRSPVFRLWDMYGRLITANPVGMGIHEVNTAGIGAGMFFYTIEAGGEVVKTGKVVKL